MGFFGKIFGKDERIDPIDLGEILVDMHSHLIPGIDDGSKSMEESIELIKALYNLGYKKLITTPHIQTDRYKNNRDIILSGLDSLRNEVEKEKIPIELDAAAEYLIDDGFTDKMSKGGLLTFGKNYLLVELSYFSEPFNLKNTFFELQTDGYNVVLAHPERYTYWHNRIEIYEELVTRGIFLQLNINSLTGWYSKESKEIAEKLIDRKLIRFLGTDTHNQQYLQELQKSTSMPTLLKALKTNNIINKKLL